MTTGRAFVRQATPRGVTHFVVLTSDRKDVFTSQCFWIRIKNTLQEWNGSTPSNDPEQCIFVGSNYLLRILSNKLMEFASLSCGNNSIPANNWFPFFPSLWSRMLFFFCNTAWRRHCKSVSFCRAPPRKGCRESRRRNAKLCATVNRFRGLLGCDVILTCKQFQTNSSPSNVITKLRDGDKASYIELVTILPRQRGSWALAVDKMMPLVCFSASLHRLFCNTT
jgi:hypothetical protein